MSKVSLEFQVEEDGFLPAGGRPGSGFLGTFWNVTKASVGIGMLSLPYGFGQAGFGAATVTLCAMGVISNYAILSLASSQRHVKALLQTSQVAYTDTVREVLGKHWMNFAAVCIVLTQIGACVGYEIFICTTFETYFDSLSYNSWLQVLQVPLIILSAFRSLRWLSVISFGGLLCLWVGTALSFWVMGENVAEKGWAPIKPITDIGSYTLFFGLAAFSFEGLAAAALTIEQSMATPQHFPMIVTMAISFVVLLAASFALLGCFSYGANVDQVITTSFPENVLTTTVSLMFSLELLLTFPGAMYPVWKLLEETFLEPRPLDLEGVASMELSRLIRLSCSSPAANPLVAHTRARIKRAFVRTLFRSVGVLMMAVIAFVFRDNFAEFLSFVGSVAGASVMFLIPARLQLQLVERFSRAWFCGGLLLMLGMVTPLIGIGSVFL